MVGMETVTANRNRPPHDSPGMVAGKLMSSAVYAAGSYAQRARTTWTLWLRNAEKPPHADL